MLLGATLRSIYRSKLWLHGDMTLLLSSPINWCDAILCFPYCLFNYFLCHLTDVKWLTVKRDTDLRSKWGIRGHFRGSLNNIPPNLFLPPVQSVNEQDTCIIVAGDKLLDGFLGQVNPWPHQLLGRLWAHVQVLHEAADAGLVGRRGNHIRSADKEPTD